MLHRLTIFLAALMISAAAVAQTLTDLPTTIINGKTFRYYDVKRGDAILDVAKRLGVSRDEIVKANPAASDGLRPGTRLYFLVEPMAVAVGVAAPAVAPETYTVKSDESLYGISKKVGVSVDRLIELNPSARDGIRKGDVLVISAPAAAAPVENTVVAGIQEKTHVIAKGETLYRIAAANNLTVEDLLAANPNLDAANYGVGTKIVIPSRSLTPATIPAGDEAAIEDDVIQVSPVQQVEAKVEVPDSIPGNDLGKFVQETSRHPVAEEVAAIESPAEVTPTTPEVAPTTPEVTLEFSPAEAPAPGEVAPVTIIDQPAVDEAKTYSVALLLPLMLGDEKPSSSAELFTDFYRGFLLGLEATADNSPRLDIRTYDTVNNADTVASLMKRPEIASADIIIGPENDRQFDCIAENATGDNTYILNVFATKSDAQNRLPNVVQINIPREKMYERAVDAFMLENALRTPVFIKRINGSADKEELTSALRDRLTADGRPFREIVFRNILTDEDLATLAPDTAYVFVPVTASRQEFLKFAPALKKYKEESPLGFEAAIFGYPEWLLFRNELADYLPALDAMLYTRFYDNLESLDTQRIRSEFEATYGYKMIESVPSQALLGYDIARFMVDALNDTRGDLHKVARNYPGVQTDINLTGDNIPGLVNDSLLLIKYSAGSAPKRKSI